MHRGVRQRYEVWREGRALCTEILKGREEGMPVCRSTDRVGEWVKGGGATPRIRGIDALCCPSSGLIAPPQPHP